MNIIKRIYIWSSGYSYTNMGRLFLRLFVGIMMMQFGIRQLYNYDEALAGFPSVAGIPSGPLLITMIAIEIFCSFCIMCGFLTRLMVLAPSVAMCVAEYYLLTHSNIESAYMLSWQQPAYLPVMFLGIYFFILLVGPGKISVDYFLSLHFLHSVNRNEEELEEV